MRINFDVVAAQTELKQTGRYMAKLFNVSEGMWSKIRKGNRWQDGIPDDKADIVKFLQEKLGHNGHDHPAADDMDDQLSFSDTESEPEVATTSDDKNPQGTAHPMTDEELADMADVQLDEEQRQADDDVIDIDDLIYQMKSWMDARTNPPTPGVITDWIMMLVEMGANRSVRDALFDEANKRWPKIVKRKTLESDWVTEERGFKAQQKLLEKQQQAENADDQEEPFPTEAERAAEYERIRGVVASISTKDDILADVVALLHTRGLAGEGDAVKLVYLGATGRVLNEPIHPLLSGPSGGGKSKTTDDALGLFPPEDVIFMTSLSPKALFYRWGHFRHRVLYIAEASLLENEDNNALAAVVRELQTRGMIVHEVTVDDPGSLYGKTTETIERKGPTTLVLTTTATTLHSENETRMLRLHITETADHTAKVFREIGRAAAGKISNDDVVTESWREFQRWIAAGPRCVCVPYAEEMLSLVPAAAVAMRRSAGHLIQLIRAHALLHQANREIVDGEVTATLDDYGAVRSIMAKAMAESVGDAPTESTQALVTHVSKKLSCNDDAVGSPEKSNPRRAVKGHVAFGADKTKVYIVATRGLARELQVDHSAARRALKRAIEDGYLVNEEMRKNHPASLSLGGRELGSYDTNTFLPSVERVRELLKNEGTG